MTTSGASAGPAGRSYKEKIRMFLFAFVVCGVSMGGFLVGRASAQQSLPHEEMTPFMFPRSWGEFRAVVGIDGGGQDYFFEAVDGSIRKVYVTNGGNTLARVQVTQRSGTAPRGAAGTPR